MVLAVALVATGLALPVPAARAQEPSGRICVTAYNDANQNGVRDPMEPLLPDVVASLLNEQAVAVASYVTDGQSEPHCFEGVAPGTYTVTFEGGLVTPTGPESFAVTLAAGQLVPAQAQFGALPGASLEPAARSAVRTPLSTEDLLLRVAIALVGAALIVVVMAIIGVIIYWRRYRPSQS
jgi:hypothetical protein